jgi:GT2 family glycosyltransferase
MISILIITYNRPKDLLDLLRSINNLFSDTNSSLILEILILNNNSSVDYVAVSEYLLKECKFSYEYILSEDNLGVAKGRNFLVEKSRGELLLFLDDDVCFSFFNVKQLLEINTDSFFTQSNTGILTYNIRFFENKEIQPSAFPHKKRKEKIDLPKFLTYYYTGAVHLIRKSVFNECGLYPTDFFYGMEEYDLSYRALNRGYSIAYSNAITFLHKESPLGRKPKSEQLRMMWVNKCKVAYKYLPKKYFYSTAAMWSVEYFIKAGADIKGWMKGWSMIAKIPSTQSRQPISTATLQYLARVEARLWY